MTILDRYIARHYLANVLLLLVILLSFVVMVDVSLNLDRFIDTAARLAPESDSPVRRALLTVFVIADLWGPRLLQLFNLVLGLVLVGAMGFTYAQLVRHREIVAVLASGVSLFRVARPVLLTAAILSGLQAANQEFIIPRIAHLLTRDNGDAGQRLVASFPVQLMRDASNRLFYATALDPATATVTDLRVWERDASGRAVRRITAPSATWTGSEWRLDSGLAQPMQARDPAAPSTTTLPSSSVLAGSPIESIPTDLDPDQMLIRHYSTLGQSLSWLQIYSMLSTPGLDPQIRERLHRTAFSRVSNLICNFLALVISIPFFLTREPRNMVFQALKCAPVAMGALIGGVLGAAAPIPGLPAAFAVFLPVFMLAPAAIAMACSIKS